MTCPFCAQPGSWPTCSCDGAAFARSHGFQAATRRYDAPKSDSAPQPPSLPKPQAQQPQPPPPPGGEAAAAVTRFAAAILHGSPNHRQWLTDAAIAFNAGQPLPPPRNATTPNWINPGSAVDHAARQAIVGAFNEWTPRQGAPPTHLIGPDRFQHACPDLDQNADDSHLVFPEETPTPANPPLTAFDEPDPSAYANPADAINNPLNLAILKTEGDVARNHLGQPYNSYGEAIPAEIDQTTATPQAAPAAPARDAAPIASASSKDRKKAANEKRRASCKEYWTTERRQQAREFSIARHAAAKALRALQS